MRTIMAPLSAIVFLSAPASAEAMIRNFEIPAGPLKAALDVYVRQSGQEVVYRPEHMLSARSGGARGAMSSDQALKALLKGTGMGRRVDASGAVAIVPVRTGASLVPSAASARSAAFSNPSSPLIEQSADTGLAGLEEIIVTAQKRRENLQDVPIVVTNVSGEKLTTSGVVEISNLSTMVPGLLLHTTAAQLQPHIRGIGSGSAGPGIENPVAIYVDDVYLASQFGAPTDLADVADVTVLKGPQGTLFGRNATGGVVSIRTREPKETFGAEIRSSLDNYLTTRTNVYLTGGLAEGISANLSLTYNDQGKGWGTNRANGDETYKIDQEYAARAKIAITPSDSTEIKLAADYRNSKLIGGSRQAPGTLPLPFLNLPSSPLLNNLHDGNSFLTPRTVSKGGGASAYIEQDVGFARLASITSYRDVKFATAFTGAGTPVAALNINARQFAKQFTQEVQLLSNEGGPLTWLLGGYYFHSYEGVGDGQFRLFFGALQPPAPFDTIAGTGKIKTDSWAGFGQATYALGQKTDLTVGLRYTTERRGYVGFQEGLVNGVSIGAITPIVDERQTFNKLTWRLALDHRIAEDVMAYISYNRGFKSGGFSVLDPFNPPYKPEVLDAFEAGVKTELLDRRLRVNVGGFYYKYKQIQVSTFTTNQFVFNGAGAELYGIDLDFEGRVSSQLRISGGFEWNHARFTSFPNAPFFDPIPGGGFIQTTGNAAGNRLSFAPEITASLSVDYSIDLNQSRIDLNATNAYSSSYPLEPNNFLVQGAYNNVNLSATWVAADDALSVGLWARNLLDKKVLTAGTVAGYGAPVNYGSPPLQVGVSVRLKFGSVASGS